jgi:xanthine dehydrogenase YagS FAD-binding subunit
MQAFEYANPTTLQDALGLLGAQFAEASVLAGGTDLISLMKDNIAHPKRVVNIKSIAELGGIRKTATGLRIGATVTIDELVASAAVRAEYPALVGAARGIASPQIRNMGTVGGDLCQRPRCWYYRNGFGLLAQQNGKSLVVNGQNEFHSIFSDGPAYFVSASSFGPALVALGAKVKLVSKDGSREVDAAKFFLTPTQRGQREIDLKPNEILTEILIPAAKGSRNATYEVRQKEALDWPLVAASVSLKMKGAAVESAQVVLGHVGPAPHVAAQAASGLAGKTISEAVAAEAGNAAAAGAKPLSGNAYKVDLVKVAVKRALLEAAKKA